YTSNGLTFQGSFKLTEQLDMITKGLSISAQIAFNTTFTSLSDKYRSFARYSIIERDVGEITYTKIGENTSLINSESQANQLNSTILRTFIDYNRSFGKNDIDGTLFFND